MDNYKKKKKRNQRFRASDKIPNNRQQQCGRLMYLIVDISIMKSLNNTYHQPLEKRIHLFYSVSKFGPITFQI